MNGNHVRDEMLAYVNGNLDPAARSAVSVHVAECEECRRELESVSALWSSLSLIPEEKPSPHLRSRFYDALRAYEEMLHEPVVRSPQGRKNLIERLFPKNLVIQFGFTLAILAAGLIVGYAIRGDRIDQTQLAQLHGEVSLMSRLLAVSLLQQQSASERLKGVSISSQMDNADPEITAALLQALKYDLNVNVRLAALDALARSARQPAVRRELIQSLPKQTSPLVQIAIIDLMVEMQEKESVEALRKMMSSPGINTEVKKKIEQSIQQLS